MKTKREHARAAIAEKVKMRIQRDEAIKLAVDSAQLTTSVITPSPADMLKDANTLKKERTAKLADIDARRAEIQSHLA